MITKVFKYSIVTMGFLGSGYFLLLMINDGFMGEFDPSPILFFMIIGIIAVAAIMFIGLPVLAYYLLTHLQGV